MREPKRLAVGKIVLLMEYLFLMVVHLAEELLGVERSFGQLQLHSGDRQYLVNRGHQTIRHAEFDLQPIRTKN